MKTGQYVIAIGASAGGLQQLNTFFDFTPIDHVSYIIIQHLSPDFKSMMAMLLAKHSKLNIVEAVNGMAVEMNKIYLIPSKNVMTIKDGRLILTDKKKGINYTIDTFFMSLAEERGDKAIGVLLSGTGTDGTEGMKAIKKAGGMLMASEPQSSEFDQMPSSIIDTGLVDYVVPPEEMPKVIQRHVNKEVAQIESGLNDEEEAKVLQDITGLIKSKLPEDFSDYKKSTILRRIKRRVSLHNLSNIKQYFNVLKNDTVELQNLAKDFLISVTSFFRDKEAFEILAKKVIPELIQAKQNDDIKIWIAGCATGEEAYSIAILILEQLEEAKKSNTVKIFATDIDSEALQIAGKGCYNESIEKDMSPGVLEKFFIRDTQGYKIKPAVREMLIFAYHDLVQNPPYCNMDLISCRNLLIYMNHGLQKKILGMLHFGLRNGGYLFLGPSENVADLTLSLEEVNKKWKIYKNIEAKRTISFEPFISTAVSENKMHLKQQQTVNAGPKKSKDPAFNIDTNLLIDLGYAGLWIDENDHVLKEFGNSSMFLLQRLFVHHLPDLLPRALQVAYETAGREADKTGKLITVKGIKLEGIEEAITLSVKPLASYEDGGLRRLVLLSENEPVSNKKETLHFDENFFVNTYMASLEEELKALKESLASAHELLQASNENMQSFNEELLSANEEMQSSNEEMQSINEELQTINSEYQSKIRELSDLNDDLNNYFRSNVNGQVFVNKDLILMKFSPGAAVHINLLPIDIGRPLSNISTNIRFETIEKDIRDVLLHGCVITKEIQAINGKWYQVMTMPYLRQENSHRDGAIITFNDISELKKVQEEFAQSNKSLKAINADLDNFVYTASHDLVSPINNIEQIIYLIKEQEKTLDNRTKEYVDMLSTSIVKFRAVIKEMAAIGKIESQMLKLEEINLEEMISEILASIQWKISSDNASIQTELEVRGIVFSKKNFRSILYNLINNAIKFKSPDRKPEIVITTKNLDDHILLSVRDNGMGISESKLATIFKMYKKLNTKAEGQGLGLFLINKLIDASGGKVEVESEPGKGTEFRLFFRKSV